ncbi:hypothetical protein Tco_0006049 [Tanacetum coccineum]
MSSPDDVDDKTGPHMFSNPVELPKGNLKFGSSYGVVLLEDHRLSYIGGGYLNMPEMEHGNQFGMEMEEAYGNPPEHQGYKCLNDQPNLAQELAIAQSLNVDMKQNLCNLRAENEDLKAKCELALSSYNSTLLDLNMSKQHEVDLSNMLLKVYKEKTDLTKDLGWVLKKGIPRTLKRVFKSDEFQLEVSKLLLMMLEACSFMLCDLDFEPLSLSLSSMPSCDLVSLTNMLILLHYLESFKSELAENLQFSWSQTSHTNPSDKILKPFLSAVPVSSDIPNLQAYHQGNCIPLRSAFSSINASGMTPRLKIAVGLKPESFGYRVPC